MDNRIKDKHYSEACEHAKQMKCMYGIDSTDEQVEAHAKKIRAEGRTT